MALLLETLPPQAPTETKCKFSPIKHFLTDFELIPSTMCGHEQTSVARETTGVDIQRYDDVVEELRFHD
jgi:hypothetical protein